MVILMLTDVLLEGGTQLLYVGSDEAIRNAFSAEPKGQRPVPPRGYEPEKTGHSHAVRPVGIIFTRKQSSFGCSAFSAGGRDLSANF